VDHDCIVYSWPEFRPNVSNFDKMESHLSCRAQMSKKRSNLKEEMASPDPA
jgi:hypothetical protein